MSKVLAVTVARAIMRVEFDDGVIVELTGYDAWHVIPDGWHEECHERMAIEAAYSFKVDK